MRSSSHDALTWLRTQVFRAWTACAILVAYAYAWVDRPELLTWWKRTTEWAIEQASAALPYPWGDRIESTIGNFGLWVQITLAIIALRVLAWFVAALIKWLWRGHIGGRRATSTSAKPIN